MTKTLKRWMIDEIMAAERQLGKESSESRARILSNLDEAELIMESAGIREYLALRQTRKLEEYTQGWIDHEKERYEEEYE